MKGRNVAIVIYWSEEDQCYIGKPELPVMGGHGDTRREALEEALNAIENYFLIRKEVTFKTKPYVKESATGPTPT